MVTLHTVNQGSIPSTIYDSQRLATSDPSEQGSFKKKKGEGAREVSQWVMTTQTWQTQGLILSTIYGSQRPTWSAGSGIRSVVQGIAQKQKFDTLKKKKLKGAKYRHLWPLHFRALTLNHQAHTASLVSLSPGVASRIPLMPGKTTVQINKIFKQK